MSKCTRSHPHCNMTEACELRSEIAALRSVLWRIVKDDLTDFRKSLLAEAEDVLKTTGDK